MSDVTDAGVERPCCEWTGESAYRHHHDHLLSLSPAETAAEFALLAHTFGALENDYSQLGPEEFEEFVAVHDLQDRPALFQVARSVREFWEGNLRQNAACIEQDTVAALRVELAELRHSLATEVRTRRLAVVDPDGTERVVAEADTDYGWVKVSTSEASPSSVVLFAHDQEPDPGDGAAAAGVMLFVDGNAAATFEAAPDRMPFLWLLSEDAETELDPAGLSRKFGAR